MSGSIIVISIVALLFAFIGVGSIIAPTKVLAPFGVHELTRDGRNEVRSVYGGGALAIATVLFEAIFLPEIRMGALFAMSIVLGGLAAGRILSALIDRGMGRNNFILSLVELTGCCSLLWASGVLSTS